MRVTRTETHLVKANDEDEAEEKAAKWEDVEFVSDDDLTDWEVLSARENS